MSDTPAPKGFHCIMIDDSPPEPLPETTAARSATAEFHQRIEAEVRRLMDGGIDTSRMSLRHGHVGGLPAAWLAIDGTDVAQFTIRFVVPKPTEPDPT